MTFQPIRDPVAGESVAAVVPDTAADARTVWHRRLNLYTGRTLSHGALAAEQEQRAGRLATRSQMLSSGIVDGLEIGVEPQPDGTVHLVVQPGLGLTAAGEDVLLPQPLRVPAAQLPTWPTNTAPPTGPIAGVLVLEPVVVEGGAPLAAAEVICADVDDDDRAFADPVRVDGVRLWFYPWPTVNFMPMPEPGPRWRNRLAYAIFDAERALGAEALLPWAEAGVPLAVLAYETVGAPLFVDRAAVARLGGRPPRRTALLPDVGQPFLWQARVEQFAEQLAESPEVSIADMAAQFRYLPPVGLLPTAAIDARAGRDFFFPPFWNVNAVPVPEEQLDLALTAGASLRPLDTFATEAVEIEVLVPVPAAWYEPDLLRTEAVDAEFAETIARYVLRRGRWLQRRDDLRLAEAVMSQALRGGVLQLPAPDRTTDEGTGTRPAQLEGGVPPFAVPAGSVLGLRVGDSSQVLTFAGDDVDLQHLLPDDLNTLLRAASVGLRATQAPETGRLVLQTLWRSADATLEVFAPDDNRAAADALGLPLATATGSADAAEPIDVDDPALSQPELAYGVDQSGVEPVVPAIQALRATLERTPLRRETTVSLDQLPIDIPADLQGQLRYDGNRRLLIVRGALTKAERDLLVGLSDEQPYRTAIAALYRQSQADELSQLDAMGLDRFITFLQAKVDRANDVIDFGFLRVQTDIYRIRQSILGTAAASRLATSPILAGIAKGETATATRDSLTSFLEATKGKEVTSGGANNVPTPYPEQTPAAATRGLNDTAMAARLPVADVFEPGANIAFGTPGPASGIFAGPTRFPNSGPAPIFTGDIKGGIFGGATSTFPGGIFGGATSTFPGGILGGATPSTNLGAGREALSGVILAEAAGTVATNLVDRTRLAPDVAVAAELFREPTARDITEQQPIIGKAYDFRTTTVAERLEKSEALEAKTFTVASKFAVVSNVVNLDIALDDLEVPGFQVAANDQPRTLGELRARKHDTVDVILAGRFDPDPANGDEAAFFATGVKALDQSVATMRVVEGRVQSYKRAVELCRAAQSEIGALVAQLGQRLGVVEGELAEARHDVAVARALLAEEQQRVDAINERRDRIVAEHVRFVLFQRPRTVDLLRAVPTRALDAANAPPPVPACLAHDAVVPQPIRAMVDLLREAPLHWFPPFRPILDRLDRLPLLASALQSAKVRAQVRYPAAQSGSEIAAATGRFAGAIKNVFGSQQTLVAQQRAAVAQLDVSQLANLSWQRVRDQAGVVLSPGDLIDGDHGRSDVAQLTSAELDQLAQVATCLYGLFGSVLPAIRLDWAERLSQYDAPVNLRSLRSLPRWDEIDRDDRREMQQLVDWLWSRVDPNQPRAVAIVNDLVRVCLLLASHAPVNQLITGRIVQTTRVTPGSRVDIAVDLAKVRVGMQVLLYRGPQVVAQGIVEDLVAGKVATRVQQVLAVADTTRGPVGERSVLLDADAQAHFSDAPTFTRSVLLR